MICLWLLLKIMGMGELSRGQLKPKPCSWRRGELQHPLWLTAPRLLQLLMAPVPVTESSGAPTVHSGWQLQVPSAHSGSDLWGQWLRDAGPHCLQWLMAVGALHPQWLRAPASWQLSPHHSGRRAEAEGKMSQRSLKVTEFMTSTTKSYP